MIFKWVLVGTFLASYIGEDDGRYVHLYEWYDENRTPHHVSFNHTHPIRPENVKAIKVECDKVYGVDEEATKQHNIWTSYRAYVCNGFEVIMTNDKKVIVDKELKKQAEEKTENFDFEEQMRLNDEKKKKAAEDRAKANKGVLKGYKIK